MLTRDGMAEPVSRDQIPRRVRGQGKFIFPVQLTTSGIGNLIRLIHTLLYVMTIHTHNMLYDDRTYPNMYGIYTAESPPAQGQWSPIKLFQ